MARKKPNKSEQAWLEALFTTPDLNYTEATRVAYPRQRYPNKYGVVVASRPHIVSEIEAFKESRLERTQVHADYVLQRLMETDQMDILDILNDDFTLKPLSEWPQVWRQNLSGFDVTELFDGSGDVKRLSGHLKKLKFPDKLKTLELLGKHIGVQAFKDRVEHEGEIKNTTPVVNIILPEQGSTDASH